MSRSGLSGLSGLSGVVGGSNGGPPRASDLVVNATLAGPRTVTAGALDSWGDPALTALEQAAASKKFEWQTDPFGDGNPAAYADGVGDQMDGTLPVIPTEFTYAVRVRISSTQAGQNEGIMQLATGAPDWSLGSFESMFHGAAGEVTYYAGGPNRGAGAFSLDAWHNIVTRITTSGTIRRAWLDGTEMSIASQPASVVLEDGRVRIGFAANIDGDLWFRSVLVYRIALTAGEAGSLNSYMAGEP